MADQPTRPYRSPLRDEQGRRTHERILDALVELLGDRRADDITTREIADRAGVSQPTVYRHFPDRTALLEGITTRVAELMGGFDPMPTTATLDDVGARFEAIFATSDAFAVEVRAEALLNADPRRYSPDTQRHSATLLDAVASTFPALDDRRRTHLAGLLRCLGSSQSWLRMREEFGVPGAESGPLVRWAIGVLVTAVRNGELPELDTAPHPHGGKP